MLFRSFFMPKVLKCRRFSEFHLQIVPKHINEGFYPPFLTFSLFCYNVNSKIRLPVDRNNFSVQPDLTRVFEYILILSIHILKSGWTLLT